MITTFSRKRTRHTPKPKWDGIDGWTQDDVRVPNTPPNPKFDRIVLADYSHKKRAKKEMVNKPDKRFKFVQPIYAGNGPERQIPDGSITCLLDLAARNTSRDMRKAKRHHADRYTYLRGK